MQIVLVYLLMVSSYFCLGICFNEEKTADSKAEERGSFGRSSVCSLFP